MYPELVLRDRLTLEVTRVMDVEQIKWHTGETKMIVQFTGRLLGDSLQIYDRLEGKLAPMDIFPLFRMAGDRHQINLVWGKIEPKKSNPLVNLVLFLLTVLSILFAGAVYSSGDAGLTDLQGNWGVLIHFFISGWPFAVSLLAILIAHEFGHYFAARYHHVAVTLPYFIPFPLSLFGTMGAFIKIKEPVKNKRVLLDIGIAGPLAGFIVAVPILIAGLFLSEVHTIPTHTVQGQLFEGNSLFYLLLKYLVHGKMLPVPASYGGQLPLFYWMNYFFTGSPLPLGGEDIYLHPVAWAGWAGLLVTAFNLIPAGQLDGGHLIYTLFGEKTNRIIYLVWGILFLLGFVWAGWWFWLFLLFLLGRAHAEPLDQITPVDRTRRILAVTGLILLVLLFTPVPMIGG